tara:strand:- start:2705 stop:3451 length:747 start_codon:yes stop_codon:yes gene_type:complete
MNIHLGCGLGNRLFAIMKMLPKYHNVNFVWEKIGEDYIAFDDLFYLDGYSLNFSKYSESKFIHFHPWISETDRLDFNTTGKQEVKKSNTIACCTCGFEHCEPDIIKHIYPHKSLWRPLVNLYHSMDKNRTSLHVRNNPKERLYRPKLKHIKKFVKQNHSYIAFERYEDVKWLDRTKYDTLLQNDFREMQYGRLTKNQLLSSVFDMYVLSFSKNTITTKKYSTFSKISNCLRMHFDIRKIIALLSSNIQ